MHHTVRLTQEPVRPDLDENEENKDSVLHKFESRKNFDKLDDDNKFFEQVKHRQIEHVLVEDRLRHIAVIAQDELNHSYVSNSARNPLDAFKIDLKIKQREDYVKSNAQILPAQADYESTRREVSISYSKPAEKLSVLKGFMVQ